MPAELAHPLISPLCDSKPHGSGRVSRERVGRPGRLYGKPPAPPRPSGQSSRRVLGRDASGLHLRIGEEMPDALLLKPLCSRTGDAPASLDLQGGGHTAQRMGAARGLGRGGVGRGQVGAAPCWAVAAHQRRWAGWKAKARGWCADPQPRGPCRQGPGVQGRGRPTDRRQGTRISQIPRATSPTKGNRDSYEGCGDLVVRVSGLPGSGQAWRKWAELAPSARPSRAGRTTPTADLPAHPDPELGHGCLRGVALPGWSTGVTLWGGSQTQLLTAGWDKLMANLPLCPDARAGVPPLAQTTPAPFTDGQDLPDTQQLLLAARPAPRWALPLRLLVLKPALPARPSTHTGAGQDHVPLPGTHAAPEPRPFAFIGNFQPVTKYKKENLQGKVSPLPSSHVALRGDPPAPESPSRLLFTKGGRGPPGTCPTLPRPQGALCCSSLYSSKP